MLQEDGSKFFPEYDVVVYPDNDPKLNKYYYSSTQPRLYQNNDGDYGLTLIGFDPPPQHNAGTLSLVVDLSVSQEALNAIRKQLSKSEQTAILEPIPWISGTSTLALASATKIFTAKPSLLDNNAVVFNIPLSLNDFIWLQGILKRQSNGDKADEMPIGIVYNLAYNAVRKALKCSVTMNWDKFYQWRQKKCEAKILFLDVSKTDTVEELKQEGVFQIDCVIDGDEQGTELQLLQLLTDAFFEPLPVFEKPKAESQGGWGLGFSCTEKQDTQIVDSFLNSKINVESAFVRQQYLQGIIANLRQAFVQNKIQFISIASNSPFTQSLTIHCYGNFQQDRIERINLTIFDPQGEKVIYLNPNPYNFRDNQPWSIELTYDREESGNYSYEYTIYFDSQTDRHPITTPEKIPIERSQTDLAIIPRDYYTVQAVPVLTNSSFPWDLMQSIYVSTKITENGLENSPLVLNPETKETTWILYSPESNSFDFYYKVQYITPNKYIKIDWVKSANIISLNAFTKRTVTFSTQEVNWQKYSLVQIGITAKQKVLYQENQSVITFKAEEANRTANFTYYYTNNTDKALEYYAIYIPNDGSSQTLPTQTTSQNYVNLPNSPS